MGNCLSCCKVPTASGGMNQSTILEQKNGSCQGHLVQAEENRELPDDVGTSNNSRNDGHRRSARSCHCDANRMIYHHIAPSIVSPCTSCNDNRTVPLVMVPTPLMQTTATNAGSGRSRPPRRRRQRSNDNNTSIMNLDNENNEERNKIQALFEKYKAPNGNAISVEGIDLLCKDLNLAPTDFQILVLAWKLNARQMCKFTQKEFEDGLKSMKVESIKEIREILPTICNELEKNRKLFRDLYKFVYKFGLDNEIGQRNLPADIAIKLWILVFTIHRPNILDRWINFLECRRVKFITRDTWLMFLAFIDCVKEDFSDYDESEAWPSLFDEFVEFETNNGIVVEREDYDDENL
ncbi:hypothetical protein TKK_0018256 [Trichogramma kaykai]|uniref:Defective in cullin neddylation protein n=1 Tax=Trichogramma kaykai TaxID=54128 RepID=A0ABD2VYY6_9HYME